MKMNKLTYIALGMALGLTSAHAQDEQQLIVKDKLIEKTGDALLVNMVFDLTRLDIPANRSLVYTPVIVKGDSLRSLPPLIVNGRERHILYERTGRNEEANHEFELRRKNGSTQTFDYHARVPMARWMEKSEVALVIDECGCGWEALQNQRTPLFAVNLAEPLVLAPMLAYQTPVAETVKARAKEGQAYLDFPVNKIAIYPDYRNNPQELRAIRETIESVRNDKYATITEVYIKGYASPEGTYANNAYLAENRAKALRDYVNELYHFKDSRFTVEFEPEDWDGLEKRVETMSLANRDELLAIIRADEPVDKDKKEWKLKTLGGGASYKILLRDVYPALRHSDYAVKYSIRNFTVEEAKELLYTDPKQLSLNEMFQVAQTCEPGSRQFNEVFEIAVRMYPDDPVSNLNAANTALRNGRTEEAKRYLAKAAPSAHKQLAEAALAMLKGDLDGAERFLLPLKDHAEVGVAATENLRQINAKRNE